MPSKFSLCSLALVSFFLQNFATMFFKYEELQKLLLKFFRVKKYKCSETFPLILKQEGRSLIFILLTSSSRNRKRANCSVSGTTIWTPCSHSLNLPGTSGLSAPLYIRFVFFPLFRFFLALFGCAWHLKLFPVFLIFPVTSQSSRQIPISCHLRFFGTLLVRFTLLFTELSALPYTFWCS
jgi:hypothetical protein